MFLQQADTRGLRLRFGWEEKLRKSVEKKGTLDWRYIDLSQDNIENQAENIQTYSGNG